MMKSVIVNKYGGPEVLKIENVEKPLPKANEVQIKIKATAVTAASTFMREGKPYFGRLFLGLRKPKARIPGTDLSGVVSAIGTNVTGFKVGDEVMAETAISCGAYAEYICLAEDDLIVHKPQNVSHEEATGILDGGSTALAFFTDSVTIKPGQKVLINGASGSIGTAAVQLAKHFGAEVTGVCSGKNKALVRDLGADFVLDYTKNQLETTAEKFDVIFDTVGKCSFGKTKRLLKENGVFLTPVLSLKVLFTMLFNNVLSRKKLKFAATGMRKKELQLRDLEKIREMMAAGNLVTVIDAIYPLAQVREAHTYVDSGRKRGNVILVP